MQTPNEPFSNAPIPEPTGFSNRVNATFSGVNDSGTGPNAVLPPELQGFNVGAFFLNWIWSINHKTWIGLLALIPCVGLVFAIMLGIKGNEYAWQNRKWDSIEQFKATQKIWMYWGIGIVVAGVVLQILSAILGASTGMQNINR